MWRFSPGAGTYLCEQASVEASPSLHLPNISPISPYISTYISLYLPNISPISPYISTCISQYLPNISPYLEQANVEAFITHNGDLAPSTYISLHLPRPRDFSP